MTQTQKGRIFHACAWGFSHKDISRFALGREDRWIEVKNLLYRFNLKVTDYRNRRTKQAQWIAQSIRDGSLVKWVHPTKSQRILIPSS